MATNKIFEYDQRKVRERVVPTGTQPGTPLHINTRPAVTITARGDATKTDAFTGTGISVTYPNGGAGNASDSASVAFDGSFEFAVTGALTTTGQDVAVYLTTATGVLTLTENGTTPALTPLYGYTDYPVGYIKVAGRAVVRIGA